jgi:hypothetical protein
MRRRERIPIFLGLLNWEVFCETYLLSKDTSLSEETLNYWMENPDLRFGQMLIGQQISLWSKEEDEFLEEQGVPPQDFLEWEQVFDADGNRLPNTKYLFIKDMNSDHIKAVLNSFYPRLRPSYSSAFIGELRRRGDDWSRNEASP